MDWNVPGRCNLARIQGRSPCGNVDWNVCSFKVGLHVVESFPVRERGLKRWVYESIKTRAYVVPRAGTWIETSVPSIWCRKLLSFPVRERGLKPLHHAYYKIKRWSFPVRERGLKPPIQIGVYSRRVCRSPCGNVDWNFWKQDRLGHIRQSFPVRERGLKQLIPTPFLITPLGRSPCGNVDWNIPSLIDSSLVLVVPRAGTWIET